MTCKVNADTTNGLKLTSDTSGEIDLQTNGTTKVHMDSSGNVGIGTSSPSNKLDIESSTQYKGLEISNGSNIIAELVGFGTGNDAGGLKLRNSGTSTVELQASGNSFINGGNVGIGTSSPDQNLHVSDTSTNAYIKIISNDSNTAGILFGDQNSGLQGKLYYLNGSDAMRFDTNGSERMRISSSGVLGLGSNTTSSLQGSDSTDKQFYWQGNYGIFASRNDLSLILNRQGNDGTLVSLRQAGSSEGSISVSGTTVSYNGGHLSRWGRLADGSQPTILKGTVMSNLDEMVVWSYDDVLYTEEDELPDGKSVGDVKTPAYTAENEQRNQLKVSDVEGDINVAGLFVKWDTEEDGYNDIDLAMTGDMVIRIAQGTTVQRGDLLMSAGDGTAKPQEDDIVRSKTIAKVISTTVINTYDDGSYVVPCVVMAC